MRKFCLRFLTLFVVCNAANEICCAQVKVIPTVFHILHQGGSENISDTQVFDAMRILNEDYNKHNADTAEVASVFKNNIADMQVEFRLAGKDPAGNCTNGIEHIYSTLTDSHTGASDYVKINDWPRDKYLNIWVIKSLTAGIAGYAYLPAKADTLPEFDGIMMISNYVGSIGTGLPYASRSLTYETGKYFNLLPLSYYGNGQCGDDSVSDTPLTRSSSSCDTNLSVCNPPVIENVQNFMGGSYCSRMFTNGQKARVQDCLNRSVANRNNLWANANLIATGTNSINPTPCAPVCDFGVSSFFVCIGNAVTFADNSYNGVISSRLWSFQNANLSTSADSTVSVTFNNTGWQTVSLAVTNAQGSNSKTKTLVFVADTTAILTPYYNGFEDGNEFAQNWGSINPDNDQHYFHRVSNAGYNSASSILLNNFNNTTDGNYDELVTPVFDITPVSSNTDRMLHFKYSCASLSPDPIDSMVVYAMIGCGNSWVKIYSSWLTHMFSAVVDQNYFIPATSAFWQTVTAYIPTAFAKPNVRFKFKIWSEHHSNNFYLDDFSVGPLLTGISETSLDAAHIFISPNPASSTVTISVGESMLGGTVTISDITGQTVPFSFGEGARRADEVAAQLVTRNLQLATDNFANGIYFVTLTTPDGRSATKKLVKQ